MAVNYNDSRFQEVETEKQQALNNVNNLYGNMINNSDKYYQDQINAAEQYGQQQSDLIQQQGDLAVEKIEQQKEWAKQDYTKEQKASYVDWQKQSDAYGVNAESRAAAGLSNTGYAESSQVAMYTAYQNRVAVARESFNRAIAEYDIAAKDARLQNSSKLLEIANQTLQIKLELSLQGFQYKNTLLQQQLEQQNQTEDRYYTRWQNVLNQINTENSLAEQQRQFNANLALQQQQLALQKEELNWQKQQAALKQASVSKSSSSGGSSSSSKSSSSKNSDSIKQGEWLSAQEMANSLGLPAAVNLSNVLSTKEYEKKTVNGIAYYRKK